MAKNVRKLFAMLLTVCMVMSLLSVSAFAEETSGEAVPPAGPEYDAEIWPVLEGEKTAAKNDAEANLYDVTVKIPGGEGVKKHDHVVVMVDGSYSMDDEWHLMKAGITEIADTVLGGVGNTKLSVMAFGMSPNVVTKNVESVEELEQGLPALPGGLLYGRSSTNCHAAFLGLQDYVAELKQNPNLKNVYVVFLSDGGANQHAQLIEWDSIATNIDLVMAGSAVAEEVEMLTFGGKTPSEYMTALYGEKLETMKALNKKYVDGYYAYLAAGGTPDSIKSASKVAALLASLPNDKAAAESALTDAEAALAAAQAELDALPEDADVDTIAAKQAEVAALEATCINEAAKIENISVKLAALTDYDSGNRELEAIIWDGTTRSQQYVQQIWEDFWTGSGLSREESYPVHVMETAFLKYQEKLSDQPHIEGAFYSVAARAPISDETKVEEYGTQNSVLAAEQATVLAGQVDGLYMVRYTNDSRAPWMEKVGGDNVTYAQAANLGALVETLDGILTDLEKTPYNDVTVTDYMSKWVNLKPETVKVKDKDGNVVAEYDEANSDVENGVYTYKWTGASLCPVTDKAPIVLEKVDPENYAAGGDDVVGNTNGDIYKITWNIKDGPLYRADNYYLTYQVTVDTAEDGFVYGKDYPANGNTNLYYTDENGGSKDNKIDVPNVVAPAYKVTVKYLDKASGNQIAVPYVSEKAPAGTDYNVTEKDQIAIPGYTYDSTSGDALEGILDEDKEIIVYYTIVSGGGGEGGSTTPNPPTPPADPVTPDGGEDLDDPEVPLNGLPEEGVEIGEEDVPLTALPEEEIFDEEVPLAMAPATGDVSAIWMAMSALSGAGLFLTRKKRDEE